LAKAVVGVLVMAYGTPNKKEEILPYYTHIRRGRAPSEEQLRELIERYELIGGRSNLNEITSAQAEAIGAVLNDGSDEIDYRIYVGNKHWSPWIADTVKQMAEDGIRKAVAIVLAPQGSKMSSGSYMEYVDKGLAELAEPIEFVKILNWHLEPDYIQAVTEKVAAALANFSGNPKVEVPVVFTAHSLPERILTWGDPYPTHLREIGEAVAAALGLKKVHFGYQSAGRTPEPWLGPDINDVIKDLHAVGEKSVLACSVGFISDHLEVIYDLDYEAKVTAERLGMHFERMGMLNAHPLLASALAGVARRAAMGELA
jgi:ferrochelatase